MGSKPTTQDLVKAYKRIIESILKKHSKPKSLKVIQDTTKD